MNRTLRRLISAVETSDGAGVRIRRSLGQTQHHRLDPFLMLDEFGSENADDYIAGFPAHPHRGFETVTYMLEGHMRHEDHLGNRGDLRDGGVQWMTAGRGIVHSEMPQQTAGRMHGFQLWLNLPAAEKMQPAAYRDLDPEEFPVLDDGERWVRIIAGEAGLGDERASGPIRGVSTEPVYLDIRLRPDCEFRQPLPAGHSSFVYVYAGQVTLPADGGEKEVPAQTLAVLDGDGPVMVTAGADGARLLLLAGRPIGEPVAQYGPFVMNTREELEQAMADYRSGRLTA